MYKSKTTDPLWRDDSGAGTAWWVLWMLIFMIFGGVSVDSANAWRMRAQLQSTADAAALAGVVDLPNETSAKQSAISFATKNMNTTDHGDVLVEADVEFGLIEVVFVEDPKNHGQMIRQLRFKKKNKDETIPTIAHAISVKTRRDVTNANRLKTYFLRLIGMDSWNVSAQAIAERYYPRCQNKDGIYARHIVDLQSNNHFRNGICIHGNDHVELNNGNTWDPGVSVSMPHLEDLVTPSSDLATQNPGLADSLKEEYFIPKIVDQIPQIIESLKDPLSEFQPSYIGKDALGVAIPLAQIVITVPKSGFNPAQLLPGHIYNVDCSTGGSLLNLNGAAVVSKVVIVTDCRVNTGNNTIFKDVILAAAGPDKANGTDPKSINIGSGNQFGEDDGCAPTGNVQLLAKDSIHGSAGMTAFGAQFAAGATISLAAQAEGLEGILIQAGKDASITSNNSFGSTCLNVGAIEVPHYRLVL